MATDSMSQPAVGQREGRPGTCLSRNATRAPHGARWPSSPSETMPRSLKGSAPGQHTSLVLHSSIRVHFPGTDPRPAITSRAYRSVSPMGRQMAGDIGVLVTRLYVAVMVTA